MSTEVPEITADEAQAAIATGALLLDVREPDEWEAGHAPDALHLPMRERACARARASRGSADRRDLPLGQPLAARSPRPSSARGSTP